MAIFHFFVATPVLNDPEFRSRLDVGSFLIVAETQLGAWQLIRGHSEVAPASEVWVAETNKEQKILITPNFKPIQSEEWALFVEWSRSQDTYSLIFRAGLDLKEWSNNKFP